MIKSALKVSLPGNTSQQRWTCLRMREEFAFYAPAIILLKRGNRCVEITVDLFFDLLRDSGIRLRGIPWEITVPRRGWIVLVPRSAGRRRTYRRTA